MLFFDSERHNIECEKCASIIYFEKPKNVQKEDCYLMEARDENGKLLYGYEYHICEHLVTYFAYSFD